MSGVALDIEDGVGVVCLDNPPLNLFTRELTRNLGEVLSRVEADDTVRAVVVTGAGTRAFSAGSDIREFPDLMDSGRVVEDKLALENEVFDRLARLPQPTIAAIVGVALGGGAELALCCDYRIIDDAGRIGFPEIHLGTIPGSGGLSRLPRLINPGIAMRLLLDGEPVDARQALDIGLVNEVVEGPRLMAVARSHARLWASRPAGAVRAIKRAVHGPWRDQVSAEMIASLEVSRAIFATEDMREGVAAFREKRKPRFRHG
jgi:enoyl-CoA hydratase/carnithine racemase